jgi:hypothetical protein
MYNEYVDEVELDEEEDKEKYEKVLDFKKIKALKYNDPLIKEKLQFDSMGDFSKIESVDEAALEADFSLSYLIYKYQKIFKKIPHHICFWNESLGKKFFSKIYEMTKKSKKDFSMDLNFDNKKITMGSIAFKVSDMIFYHDGHSSFLVYPPEYEDDFDSPLYVFLGLVKTLKNPIIQKNKIYVVYRTDKGFQKKAFDIKKRKINIKDHYNDDFEETSKDIISKLNDKSKTGLVILHGSPGTGKTTYIRYLAGKLKRNIIFISPDMVSHITSPEFIPFLMSNNDAILILEDAEPAIKKRHGEGRSGAVSNILNMTDGLLSDCLNISIVATFNTDMKDIDDALLRKGRLLKSYKFGNLSIEKSQKLIDNQGISYNVSKPMSLAEIYFSEEDNLGDEFKPKQMGFGK